MVHLLILGWLFKKDKLKELEKQQAAVLEQARDLQRSGDLRAYAAKIEEAEKIAEAIEEQKRQDAAKK